MNFANFPELRALRDLFNTCDPAPPSVAAAGYAATTLAGRFGTDAGLELVADSVDEPVPSKVRRRRPQRGRVLTFMMPGRIVEMDLTPTAPEMVRATGLVISRAGQGTPAGDLIVRHPDGDRSSDLDEYGGFQVEDIPRGPVSIVYRPVRSKPVVSDWLVC